VARGGQAAAVGSAAADRHEGGRRWDLEGNVGVEDVVRRAQNPGAVGTPAPDLVLVVPRADVRASRLDLHEDVTAGHGNGGCRLFVVAVAQAAEIPVAPAVRLPVLERAAGQVTDAEIGRAHV